MALSKKRHEERKAKNLCVQCNKSVVSPLKTRCDPCLSKNLLRRRAVRAKRKREGKCTECQNAAMPDCSLCKTCSHERSEASTRRYYANKRAGKCRACGAATENNESRCLRHKQWLKDWRRRHQKQLKTRAE